MTAALGWTRPGSKAAAGTQFALIEGGDLALVICDHALPSRRDWLMSVQSCHRSFEAFLPFSEDVASLGPTAIERRLSEVSGHGQLSVRVALPSPAGPGHRPTGRAYLKVARERHRSATEWLNQVEEMLRSLAQVFSASEVLKRRTGREIAMDFLLPMHRETCLRQDLECWFDSEASCLPLTGSVLSSGLWAPISFATDRESERE